MFTIDLSGVVGMFMALSESFSLAFRRAISILLGMGTGDFVLCPAPATFFKVTYSV
jgi:hypothetical protein